MASKRREIFWKETEEKWREGIVELSRTMEPWSWFWLAINPDITMNDDNILTFSIKPSNWLTKPNVEFYNYEKDFIIKEARKYLTRYLAGVKINNFIFKCYFSPYTKIGRKRFKKEFDALFG